MGYEYIEYARTHREFTPEGGIYSHAFSLKKVSDQSRYGSRGRSNWLRKMAVMDEYDELNSIARDRLSGASVLFIFGAMMYYMIVAMFVGSLAKSENPIWEWLIPSLILGAILLRLFPSIAYLTHQTRIKIQETLYSHPGKPESKEPSAFSYTKLDPSGQDLEFIKSLSEIGTPEIQQLYLAHANLIRKETIQRNNLSRMISVFLALLLFLGYWFTNPFQMTKMMQIFGFWGCPAQILVFGVWGELMLRLEYRLRLSRLRRIQVDQDRNAGDFSQVLQAEDLMDKALPSSFCLYLRPFMTTDKIHVGEMDLETILAYSLSRVSPVIALGHPGEHIGAGRIKTSDEHWQEEIMRLIDNATLIFIIPSHREGTLWEIKNLSQGKYLSKTIFIMPPNIIFEKEPYELQWKQASEAAQVFGIDLPPYEREGTIFRLDTNGTLIRKVPLGVEEFIINPHGPN